MKLSRNYNADKPDLTIYCYFEGFVLQKYHVDDIMTIYDLILMMFRN